MSLREFNSWISFYRLFPFDDAHRFYRPAALIAKSNGTKSSIRDLMEFLQPQTMGIAGLTVDQQEKAKGLMNMGFKMARQAKG